MDTVMLICAALLQLGGGFPIAGYAVAYPPGQVYVYQYDTDVVFNEPHSHGISRSKKDVGIRLSTNLQFTPVWHTQTTMLVELKIAKPKLLSVSRPALSRELKQLSKLPVYFEWEKGQVGRVFTSEDDTTLAVNVKKGIISMVQVIDKSGERTEVDASGECTATYIAEGEVITKRKTNCKNLEIAGQFSNINPILDLETNPSSVTIYELSNDIVKTMTTIEQFSPALNIENKLAGSVKSKQSLELISSTPGGTTVEATSLQEAAEKISKKHKLNLFAQLLGTTFESQPCRKCPKVLDILAKHRENLASSNMATTAGGGAFLELVEAFRKTDKQVVLAALNDENNADIIPQLIDVIVAAQTNAGQEGLMEFLNFDDEYEYALQERYLLAAAFSTHPTQKLLQDLLDLFNRNVPNENLRESIGEALGAILYSFCRVGDQCGEKVVVDIQDVLISKLLACEDAGCKGMFLRALANAGLPSTLDVILDHAENHKDVAVSEAAIRALRRFGRHLITPKVLEILKQIYHQKKRGYDSAVRSQALKVLMGTVLSQEEVQEILESILDPSNSEFSTYVLARIFNQVETDEDLRSKVQNVLVNVNISNYDVLAPNGKSLAFTEGLAHGGSMDATYDMYVENSKAHIMKRSGMDVDVSNEKQTLQLYSFGIFAAGLEGLLGEEVDEGQEDVTATAGLQLNLLDVSLRPVTFFEGQAGLMSAVWNAPSELVSALQANLLLQDHSQRLHLQNGLVVSLDVRGAVSMDLSGLISISLWNKNCNSLIKNSGAVVIRGSMALDTSAFKTGIEFEGSATSMIDFQTDVDFYDKIKMCLQMGRPAFMYRHTVMKFEKAAGFKKSFISKIQRNTPINAASYPLPRPNAEQCRVLISDNL